MTLQREEYPPVARADHAVARILAESEPDESLYPRLLEAIGDSLGWGFGAWWEMSTEGAAADPRPPARAHRDASGRRRVPGRAYDPPNRHPRPADVHGLRA